MCGAVLPEGEVSRAVWFGLDARAVLLMVGTQVDYDQLNTFSYGGGKPMLEAGKKPPLKSCDYRRNHDA
jgi:hypothetical protein